MNLYVASSWRNKVYTDVLNTLRRAGHEAYDFKNPGPGQHGFAWSELDPFWESWTPERYREMLNHPIAERGFKNDFDAMKWADGCVLVLPCGRSAHTEAGWMKGAGKRVFVLTTQGQEPELMYKVYDGICVNMGELLGALGGEVCL